MVHSPKRCRDLMKLCHKFARMLSRARSFYLVSLPMRCIVDTVQNRHSGCLRDSALPQETAIACSVFCAASSDGSHLTSTRCSA